MVIVDSTMDTENKLWRSKTRSSATTMDALSIHVDLWYGFG